jgi:hypothetical protein
MPDATQGSAPAASRWTREVLLLVCFYAAYTAGRDLQGSAAVSYTRALSNSLRLIGAERRLDLFGEESVQRVALAHRWLIECANVFYGTLHLLVTIAVLVFLFRCHRSAYRRARNALAAITALALVGFVAYPTVPPRLLPSHFGFVDTLSKFGALWSFDSGAMSKISNQYAAMPSLHFAWALWVAISLGSVTQRRTTRLLAYIYPLLTFIVIIVTANHFVLDAVFGAAIVAIGFAVTARRSHRPTSPTTSTASAS